ncbi:mitotic-spindle organizing gamma-tubulin ring associated-domain-containing protein [Auriculariales sp. MPI-PUGE-AT-0066]|nr:mitotic-spindle organizing gamma-tubulin ring associated-domain-containing protein [Auriculariales sp. MPI-PUGE-AT-0066]
MSSGTRDGERLSSAQQTIDILYEMSVLLNTKLDKDSLVTCIQMIENGANPEALAEVVRELRRENAALQAEEREHGRPGSSAR